MGCQWLPMVAMNASCHGCCHELPCETPPVPSFLAFHGHSLRCGKASLQLVLLLRQGVLRSCQKAKPVSISINSAFVRNIPMTSLYRRITPSLLPARPFSPRFSLAACHLCDGMPSDFAKAWRFSKLLLGKYCEP